VFSFILRREVALKYEKELELIEKEEIVLDLPFKMKV